MNMWLPVAGILIIGFCIASFFFPFGQRFTEAKQVIKGFGVDLEISILTAFLLTGVVFCPYQHSIWGVKSTGPDTYGQGPRP